MTNVLSVRLPAALERTIRKHAADSGMRVSDIVRLILEHSIAGQYDFDSLKDIQASLDCKLDVRLPKEVVARLRNETQRLRVSASAYIRIILYAYYTKRLVFAEIAGHYTLAENHDQKKSA